jgi:hypothetical protein
MKRRLFPHSGVARRCHRAGYVASSRLALRKNPSVSFVPLFPVRNTRAFFLDFFEIAFIVVPLLAPIAYKLGIDPIWFGVMLAVNMQTAFMHPPFGFALFYLKSVAPKAIRPGRCRQCGWPSRRWCCAIRRRTPAASPKSPSTSIPTPACRPSGAEPGFALGGKREKMNGFAHRLSDTHQLQTSHSRDRIHERTHY